MKKQELLEIYKRKDRARFWITMFNLTSFLLILLGIGYAMLTQAPISQVWKEILLLLLGGFIGSYKTVQDYWFNNTESDKEFIAPSEDPCLGQKKKEESNE